MRVSFANAGRLTAVLALIVGLLPATAAAQTGAIAGTVTDATGDVVRGAQVTVMEGNRGALTNIDGAFLITGLPAGSWAVRVTRLGYQDTTIPDVRVSAGATTEADIVLEAAAVELGGMVVSASRNPERITDAPATITKIDTEDISLSVGNSFSGALKQVKGLDYIQIGATTAAINARGFNSSFNNRMLMVTDNRISVLPESGLPVGTFTAIPKVDIAGLEVLVGPGAALYGPDASNGVLSVQTKDPLEYPGTTLEVTGGLLDKEDDSSGNSYYDVQIRHADVIGDFGYKITGEWQEVEDFENRLTYGSPDNPIPEIGVDFFNQVQRVSGAVSYYRGLDRYEVSAGWSETDGVGQTNVGRNQFDGWTYNFVQLEANVGDFYINAYRNQSQSGDSYAINRFSQNRASPAFEGMTDEEVKLASDWPSNGRLYAVEVQHNVMVPQLLETEFTWGAQFRRDIVSSDEEWLTDRLTGEDVEVDQYGVYAQAEVPVVDRVELVLAARVDAHDNYDTQFSPKAGVLFHPTDNQSLRLTYNRAFKSPTILQTNFWIPDFVPFVGVFGNVRGFDIIDATGAELGSFDALEPEENTTFELGYKGVLAERLFLDITGYRSDYENFFSPLTIIANPFAGTFATFGDETTPIVSPDGRPQILLTYFNLGEATINGVDLGANFMVNRQVNLNGTFSWIELDTRTVSESLPGGEEATALNAPETKLTLGVDWRDIGDFLGQATFRYVQGYDFLSGINQGHIPGFGTFDVSLGYEIEQLGARLNLGVQNLFTCTANDADTGEDGECGFGKRHLEMVNMPEIGAMFFLGVRLHR